MKSLLRNIFAMIAGSTMVFIGWGSVDSSLVQAQENTPVTVPSCIEREHALRPGSWDDRTTFEVNLRCTALAGRYLVADRYVSCGLAEYDRIQRQNSRVTSEDRTNIEDLCRTGQTSPPSSSTPTSSSASSSAGTNNTSSSSGNSGNRSGPTDALIFTANPNDQFVGKQPGLSTAPLKDYYINPLLLVNDRQTAFRVLINFLLGLVGAVALLFIVFNGFRYAMSRGEDAQISQAKKGIMYAVIGLIVILAAYTIVATILNFGAQPTPGNLNVGVGISL